MDLKSIQLKPIELSQISNVKIVTKVKVKTWSKCQMSFKKKENA